MAFNNKKNWRLKFITIDSSFIMNSSTDYVIGFFAIRAPKGNTRPTYFAKNNVQAIEALVGPASANWPDIVEVEAFNKEFPVYVSATPGHSDAYPSYLGGFYLTSEGLYKFYNLEKKDDLLQNEGNAFKVKVQPGRENVFSAAFKDKLSQIELGAPCIPDYEPAEGETGYGYFKMVKTDSDYYISFKKNSKLNVTAIDYDTMAEGLVAKIGTDTTYWGDNEGLWNFSANKATFKDFGFEYTSEQRADPNFNPFRDWIGDTNFAGVTDAEDLAKLLLNGAVTIDGDPYSIAFGIQDNFAYQVDIKDDCYAYFMQKSPQEDKTTIKISKIGYDKYYYEKLFNYCPYDPEVYEADKKLVPFIDDSMTTDEQEQLAEDIANNPILVFYNPEKPGKGPQFIGTLNDDDEDDIYYEDKTSNYATKMFSLQDALAGGKQSSLYHKFFKVSNEGDKIETLYTMEDYCNLYGDIDGEAAYEKGIIDGTSALPNPEFNIIGLSCSEKINGEEVSGGIFEGSLDEGGTDTYGNNIYFEEILQDDDMSFIEMRVVKKFGDGFGDLDENGFWTKKRVIDQYDLDKDGSSPTVKKFTIEGDRYSTLVMQQNLALGKLGGEWNICYQQGLIDSLIEAKLGEYDDAYIFVECTGQEVFKKYLLDINIAQQFASVISPKILKPNAKNILTKELAEKVIVNYRCSTSEEHYGTNALYAGEFEVYDDVTKRRYYRMPIGSVAKMLARIMLLKYGGVAPFWQNENGMGGQLSDVQAKRSRYQIDDDASEYLDKIGINPIVMTAEEGVMITSQKTTQDPNFLSDWSYIGHTMSFQIVKREIRDEVMRPQVGKRINNYYMALRQSQVEAILAKRTAGDDPIWEWATCDIAGVNTKLTRAQKNFIIKVELCASPFSETVTLMLDTKSLLSNTVDTSA